MVLKWLVMLIAVPALAFQAPAKPTPREKARQLLDGVVETAAGAQPQVAAAALLYVGQTYDMFDSKKAIEYLRQAFASTAAIPLGEEAHRAELQGRIASATAPLRLPDAIDMLKQIQLATDSHGDDPRRSALNAILSRLLGKQQFDVAIELVNSVGVTGPYPFASARQIFEKLPPDDNRRLSIFASAMSAYSLRPAPAFADFLARRWKELPRSMVQTALGQVIENILNDKSKDSLILTISSDKGSANLHNRQDAALFDLMHVVREIDPKRADEILDSRKELADLLQKFPEGSLGMGDKLSRNSTGGGNRPDPSTQQQMALDGAANTIAEQAMAALGKKDLTKAIDLARTIPVAERRVEVLTRIASSAGALDATTAKAIIGECIDGLKDVKSPVLRAPSWNNIAEAAHRVGDDKLAWEALDHSLADSAELYKADSDSDSPNEALRDEWPSTNAYRRVVITATKLMGIDAEPLLAQISDHDLALFARVEMAQALLERPHESWSTSISRRSKK
jgi:hypothetical protein